MDELADPDEAADVCRFALRQGDVPAIDYSLTVLLAEYDRRGAIVQAAEVAVERRDQISHDKPACYCPEGQPRDGQCMPCAPIDAVCSEYCLACALDALAAAVRAPDRGADDPNGANDR